MQDTLGRKQPLSPPLHPLHPVDSFAITAVVERRGSYALIYMTLRRAAAAHVNWDQIESLHFHAADAIRHYAKSVPGFSQVRLHLLARFIATRLEIKG